MNLIESYLHDIKQLVMKSNENLSFFDEYKQNFLEEYFDFNLGQTPEQNDIENQRAFLALKESPEAIASMMIVLNDDTIQKTEQHYDYVTELINRQNTNTWLKLVDIKTWLLPLFYYMSLATILIFLGSLTIIISGTTSYNEPSALIMQVVGLVGAIFPIVYLVFQVMKNGQVKYYFILFLYYVALIISFVAVITSVLLLYLLQPGISPNERPFLTIIDRLLINPLIHLTVWPTMTFLLYILIRYLQKTFNYAKLEQKNEINILLELHQRSYWIQPFRLLGIYISLMILGVYLYNAFLEIISPSFEIFSLMVGVIIPIVYLEVQINKKQLEDRWFYYFQSIPAVFLYYTLYIYAFLGLFIIFKLSFFI